MLPYDAILFDVDGTLLDSAPGILYTLREVFRTMGTDITGVDLMRYVGPPLRKTFAEYYDDEARIEEATELYRAIDSICSAEVQSLTAYPLAAISWSVFWSSILACGYWNLTIVVQI